MNEQELTRLIDKYSRTVFRVAYCYVQNHADAEDIVQDVFLSLYTYKKPLCGDEHIKAFLIRAAINRSKDLLKSCRRRLSLPLTEAENISAEQPECGTGELLPVVMKLKPKYSTALYMFYYEGYSVEEIAKTLGEKPSAITTRLSRGRKQLKELLTEEDYNGL